MRFEMFGIAGVHVATNTTILDETSDRYKITLDVESIGVTSMFINLTSHSEVTGVFANNVVRPQSYVGEVRRNGAVTDNRVQYARDGRVTGASTSPVGTRVPATEAEMQGTVDQLTALFMIERQLAKQDSCSLIVKVFDGLRRYDLHFTNVSAEELEVSVERTFPGATHVCHMQRVAIAGFPNSDGRTEGAYEGKIWFASLLRGNLMIPVQMEFNTEFGKVTGRLADLRAPGVHLQFGK